MKLKKPLCAFIACGMLAGTSAMAKDNIYAYNKFISTVMGPQAGYCDLAASFAGQEYGYPDVNDYFSGLISAFYDDIDGDFDNELITVDSRGVTVYQAEPRGVVFLGSIDADLIANFGDSYANVFTVSEGRKKYIGLETYGKTVNAYHLYLYDLDPETDDFKVLLEITSESNEDGIEERVWTRNKMYYSFTNSGGIETSMNQDGYADCAAAAEKAIADVTPSIKFISSQSGGMKKRIAGADVTGVQSGGGSYRIADFVSGTAAKTYIRATGIRFAEKPIVLFEDNTVLKELRIKPDIVTVIVNNETIQFLDQDPVVVDNRTLVPARGVFEALGATVEWVGETGQVLVNTDTSSVTLTLNKQEYIVNGEAKTLDVPAQLMNDRTMIPLRAVGEALGCNVDWDGEKGTATIQSVANQPEPAQPEVVQPEAVQPETAQPEVVQPEATQPETTQPEDVQPEAAQPETAQPEDVQPEATQPEPAQPEA
ncbi:MAG: hypothetical protein J1F01_03340 [Oscillospiraceae bacterium]|nr:hypothetical protein [Oscillospiraceae bacterium]